jgi:serine/threonine protein kinase
MATLFTNGTETIKLYESINRGKPLYQLAYYTGGRRVQRNFSDQAKAKRTAKRVKPANILIHRNIARIADFGMAKNFQKAGLSGMSITGQYAGTPLFMPPEQIKNFKYVKPVTDVWSMGATIYNVLTGKFPYTFDRMRDPIDIILNDNVIPIRDRDETIPRPLAEVLDKALAKRHINRFENAGTFLHELTLALK